MIQKWFFQLEIILEKRHFGYRKLEAKRKLRLVNYFKPGENGGSLQIDHQKKRELIQAKF